MKKKLPPALAQLEKAKREYRRDNRKQKSNTRVPREKSIGEETFALHLKTEGIQCEREVRVIDERLWRWDFVIRTEACERVLCIDIQGGTFSEGGHVRGVGYQNDITKHNETLLAGKVPIWFTTEDVTSGRAIDYITKLIARIDAGSLDLSST